MKYSFFYSLKVWLSSAFIAPLIYILAECVFSHNREYPDSYTELYPIFILFELIFSFITWLVFLLVTQLISILYTENHQRKFFLFIAGILLTAATFFILPMRPESFSTNDLFLDLLLSNCLCIGAGSLFFRLGPKIKPDQELSTF